MARMTPGEPHSPADYDNRTAMKGHAIEGRYRQKDAFGQVDGWLRAPGLRPEPRQTAAGQT